jgi:hypothetical protein
LEGQIPQQEEQTIEKEQQKFVCKYCGAEFKSLPELGVHSRKCDKRPKKEMEEEEERYASELFEEPKTPEQILEEVLRQHGIKESFISYAVSRSQRLGGIHPQDLWTMLRDLDSGVKSEKQIRYIVDDYYAALQAEAMKAQQAGAPISYPISKPSPPSYPRYPPQPYQPYQTQPYQPPSYYGTSYPTYQPATSYSPYPPQTYTGMPPQTLTIEDVRRIIKEEWREDRLDKLEKEMVALKKDIPQMIQEAMKQFAPSAVQVGITKEEIEQILKDREKDIYIKHLEERNKMFEEKLKEIMDKLKSTPQVIKVGEYSRDEMKLLSEGLQHLNNLLQGRQPLQTIGKIVIDLVGREETLKREREKVEGGVGVESYLPPELVE